MEFVLQSIHNNKYANILIMSNHLYVLLYMQIRRRLTNICAVEYNDIPSISAKSNFYVLVLSFLCTKMCRRPNNIIQTEELHTRSE